MDMNEAMVALADQLGLEPLSPDEDGLFQLEYDERLTLTAFSPTDSDALYLAASLIEVPDHADAVFFQRLLKLNFLLIDTRGAALSLDDEGRQVHLCLCMPFDLINPDRLSGMVSGFLETALQLQDQLQSQGASSTVSEIPLGSSPFITRV